MLELFKIAGKIDLTGQKEANSALDGIDKKVGGLGSKMGKTAKKVGKAGLLIGGAMVAAGTAAFAMVEKTTQGFDRIAKTAPKLGITTDALQEMEYWAGQNGISSQTLERAVGRLNQRMGLAAEGNEKYSSALTNLGVDMEGVKDGTISTDDAMSTAIQTLSGMTNEQEKSAKASELFGTKMARDLMPALKDGALTIEEAKAKAEELGIVIGGDTLASAEKFQDTWDNLKRTFGAVGQKIMAELMPIFQSMMDWILSYMPQIQAVFGVVFGFIENIFTTATAWIQSFIGWLTQWSDGSSDTLSLVWETFQTYLGLLIEYWKEVFTGIKTAVEEVMNFILPLIQETLTMIYEFWQENGAMLIENAKNIFNTIWQTVEVVFQAIWTIIQEILNLVVPFIQEQLQKIMKFWNENGEQIMKAVDNAFKFIKGVIEFVMPIITGVIKGAWKIISSVFETAVGVIMGIVKFFSSLLTGDFKGMSDAVSDIWSALWNGIKGIVSGAWSMLSGAFSGLWTSISGWFTGIKDDAVDWGKNMIGGFVDGIKAMGTKVVDAAKGVMDNVKNFLGFNSPAKKGEGRNIVKWGRNMVSGFTDGVDDEEKTIANSVNKVIRNVSPQVNATVAGQGLIQTKRHAETQQTNENNTNVTFNNTYTTKEMTPSEITRKQKQMWQRAAMEGGI
ncbi:phage tail protein [Paraliobacillus sediminis]|uniref:phage tail protein n=1 Tax=Paraliobacillus sediminis TaxID=1885916 RepID=UPI000E3D5D10|nr:hypothetical protein [Paraliobacillus sediminis]